MLFLKSSSEETSVTYNMDESHKHKKQKKPDTPPQKKVVYLPKYLKLKRRQN